MPWAAQLVERGWCEIDEVTLRKPFAGRVVNNGAQGSMHGVGGPVRAEHGCGSVYEILVEIDIGAPDRRFSHLRNDTPRTTPPIHIVPA